MSSDWLFICFGRFLVSSRSYDHHKLLAAQTTLTFRDVTGNSLQKARSERQYLHSNYSTTLNTPQKIVGFSLVTKAWRVKSGDHHRRGPLKRGSSNVSDQGSCGSSHSTGSESGQTQNWTSLLEKQSLCFTNIYTVLVKHKDCFYPLSDMLVDFDRQIGKMLAELISIIPPTNLSNSDSMKIHIRCTGIHIYPGSTNFVSQRVARVLIAGGCFPGEFARCFDISRSLSDKVVGAMHNSHVTSQVPLNRGPLNRGPTVLPGTYTESGNTSP
eukprot:sb/3468174/